MSSSWWVRRSKPHTSSTWPVSTRARGHQVLGEDLEAARAALEARHEDQDRVGLRDGAGGPTGGDAKW